MIFEEQFSRKPDHYPWTHQFKKTAEDGRWSDREFNFSSDLHDFKVNLNDEERGMIVRSLSTIGQLEVPVKKFWVKLGDNLPHPSISDLGIILGSQEVVHGDAYERLLEVLGLDDIFEENLKLDIIKGRDKYLKKHAHKYHTDNKKQFIYSLILFTLFVENAALFSQFYTILWFGHSKNVLKDTNKQVEYTSREENLHAMVGMRFINEIKLEHPELFDQELKDKVVHEAMEFMKHDGAVIKWILGDFYHDELNVPVVENMIKNRLNESFIEIGYNSVFDVDKELLKKTHWFDELLLGNNSTDFFHSRPTEYSKKNQSFSEDDVF